MQDPPPLLIRRRRRRRRQGWGIRARGLNKSGVSPRWATGSIILSFQSPSPLPLNFMVTTLPTWGTLHYNKPSRSVLEYLCKGRRQWGLETPIIANLLLRGFGFGLILIPFLFSFSAPAHAPISFVCSWARLLRDQRAQYSS